MADDPSSSNTGEGAVAPVVAPEVEEVEAANTNDNNTTTEATEAAAAPAAEEGGDAAGAEAEDDAAPAEGAEGEEAPATEAVADDAQPLEQPAPEAAEQAAEEAAPEAEQAAEEAAPEAEEAAEEAAPEAEGAAEEAAPEAAEQAAEEAAPEAAEQAAEEAAPEAEQAAEEAAPEAAEQAAEEAAPEAEQAAPEAEGAAEADEAAPSAAADADDATAVATTALPAPTEESEEVPTTTTPEESQEESGEGAERDAVVTPEPVETVDDDDDAGSHITAREEEEAAVGEAGTQAAPSVRTASPQEAAAAEGEEADAAPAAEQGEEEPKQEKHALVAAEATPTPTLTPTPPAAAPAAAAAAGGDVNASATMGSSSQQQQQQPPNFDGTVGSARAYDGYDGYGGYGSSSRPITAVHNSDPTEEELAIAQVVVMENGSHVLTAFRRGHDNSHTNRMQEGSYSRFLQSTRTVVEPQRLVDSFYGTAPTIGTVPRNVAAAQTKTSVNNNNTARAQDRVDDTTWNGSPATSMLDSARRSHRGGRSAPSSAGHAIRYSHFSRTATMTDNGGSPNDKGFNATARSTGSGGTMLRREVALLEDDTYNEVVAQRDRRRRDVTRDSRQPQPLDYVYYNHRSKGFYVPREQPPDATLLQYNHLYDYGPDGTRMATRGAAGGAPAPCRLNPHAQPPKTFAESRGPSYYGRTGGPRSGVLRGGVGSSNSGRGESSALPPASSLRTARAVDVGQLHCSQFRRTRTIEEVVAAEPLAAERTRGHVAGALMSGKITEEEAPAAFRGDSTHKSAVSFADERPAEGSAVVTLPAVRHPSQGSNTSSTAGVSRLRYTPRHDPSTTPSAYV